VTVLNDHSYTTYMVMWEKINIFIKDCHFHANKVSKKDNVQ
jgi:hypothetical protein